MEIRTFGYLGGQSRSDGEVRGVRRSEEGSIHSEEEAIYFIELWVGGGGHSLRGGGHLLGGGGHSLGGGGH